MKIEQNKTQYNLGRQTAPISALPSANVSKYEFLTGKGILPERNLLEKAAALKRFEYSPLGKELKKQASVGEKCYQSFAKVFNHDEKEEPVKIKKEESLTTDESNLVYNHKFSYKNKIHEYKNIEKYVNESLTERCEIIWFCFIDKKKFEKSPEK